MECGRAKDISIVKKNMGYLYFSMHSDLIRELKNHLKKVIG